MEQESSERNNAEAAGLLSFIRTYNFIASLYLFSDVLPHLAGLSRAFQRKDVNFTVVKPLVRGTKAAIDALLITPGEHFQSLPSVLADLDDCGVHCPTDAQVDQFKTNVHDKYLSTLSEHISQRFPDVELREAFSVFDASMIPTELEMQGSYGQNELAVLTDHYGPHGVIHPRQAKAELKTYNSVIAANSEWKNSTPRELMSRLTGTELQDMFPNLSKLAAIGLLMPMSTVDCERGFSALSRIKADARNRLSSRTLNSLMAIAIEGPPIEEFLFDCTCDIWASSRNRRINVTVEF